jgi:hypothetical protein
MSVEEARERVIACIPRWEADRKAGYAAVDDLIEAVREELIPQAVESVAGPLLTRIAELEALIDAARVEHSKHSSRWRTAIGKVTPDCDAVCVAWARLNGEGE